MTKMLTCLVGTLAVLILMAYAVSLPVFYGMFSFGDIEDWECYASQDRDDNETWDLSLGDPPGDYHNVSSNFYMVNLWGFINFMVVAGAGCCFVSCAVICSDSELAGIIAGILLMLDGLSYLAHFITLLVMRFRHAGRVCSGDYSDDFKFYKLLQDEEEPFLHKTGSWFFYVAATQVYLICMMISGGAFVAGVEH